MVAEYIKEDYHNNGAWKRNKNFLKPELEHGLLVEKALLGKRSATTAID